MLYFQVKWRKFVIIGLDLGIMLLAKIKQYIKKMFLHYIFLVQKNPKLFHLTLQLLLKLRLYNVFFALYQKLKNLNALQRINIKISDLTPTAQAIYFDLKTSSLKKHEENP